MAHYQITTLPNGVTIASAVLPHMNSVCVGLWVGVGGRHEPAELSGISHFIEHMLFKGTTSRTAEQISQSVVKRCAPTLVSMIRSNTWPQNGH